jgi:hypothetical protein
MTATEQEPRPGLTALTIAAWHTIAAVAVTIAIVGDLTMFTNQGQIIAAALTLIAATIAALTLITGVNGNQGAVAHWRLGPWYLIWVAFGFGVASFTWLAPQTGTPGLIVRTAIPPALHAMTAFVIVWTIGYASGPRAILVDAARQAGRLALGKGVRTLKPGARASLIMYGIGFGCRMASLVLQGSLGYLGDASAGVSSTSWYNQFLNVGATLAVAGLALAAYNHFSGRVPNCKGILIGLTVAEAVVAIVSGNKEPFVAIALAIMVAYGASTGKLPVKSFVLSVLAFLLVVLPFNVAYRQAINDNRNASTTELMAAAPALLADTAGSGDLTILDDSYDTLLRRVRLIDGVAVTMQKTPSSIPYESPMEYATAPFIGMIPRVVWPDKPILVAGYEVSQAYYGLPENVFTSSTLSTPGTLYRHGGWLVFLVAAFVLGVGFRLFDRIVRPEKNPAGMFFVVAFFPGMVKSEMDSVELLMSLPTWLIGVVLAVRLATNRAHVG